MSGCGAEGDDPKPGTKYSIYERTNKMNYEDFKDEFVEAVKDQLSEQGRDVRVEVRETNKLNESYAAITVTPEGSNVGVNVNNNSNRQPERRDRKDHINGEYRNCTCHGREESTYG